MGDSNFFDRITDLLATNLWREATMILEVVVKFNNNSSESPSILFSPDPNIIVSPRKQLLNLDVVCEYKLQLNEEDYVDYNHHRRSNKAEKGEFAPMIISKDLPPFSPNNIKAKNLQSQRRKNIKFHQQKHRRYSADSSMSSTPQRDKERIGGKGHPSEGQKMVSAALASWKLVVNEASNEEYCSPLPPDKKFGADLLQKSSIAFKSHKDENNSEQAKEKEEKPSFSARRSLDKLLSFSRLNSMKKNEIAQAQQSLNNSFLNISNPQRNIRSRSESIDHDADEEPGKAMMYDSGILDEADENENEDERKENDENVNTQNIAKQNDQIQIQVNDEEIENVKEMISNAKINQANWNKEQIQVDDDEMNEGNDNLVAVD